jgi:hypothetical protein
MYASLLFTFLHSVSHFFFLLSQFYVTFHCVYILLLLLYADDIVLHSNSFIDLQKILDKYVEYFEYVGLEIAINERNKSVYTNNLAIQNNNILKIIKNIYSKYISKELSKYEKNESYKYLGLWINLKLD